MDLNVTYKIRLKFLGKKKEIPDQYDLGLVEIQVTAKVQLKNKINLILSQIKS